MHRFLPIIAIGLAGCTSSLSSWDPLAVPPGDPPELTETADANSPYAHYQRGVQLLEDEPARAADAFHRASRLDPGWADPLYARRIALFMAEPHRYSDYMRASADALSAPGVQRVDSLYRRALMLNPFLQRQHDVTLYKSVMLDRIEADIRSQNLNAVVDRVTLEYHLDNYLRSADDETRGFIAQSEGRWNAAHGHYLSALERDPDDASLLADMARVLFRLGRYEEATAHMTRALHELRDRDEEELVRVYQSKALYEHSIGLILEAAGDRDGARDAYARSLQEDLSYHPAHLRLGELALEAGDTATAVSELALAAEIRPDDPAVHYQYGRLLAHADDYGEAEVQLRRAIELEPLFADPYRALAEALDAQDRPAEAAQMYRAFIERASRSAVGVDRARSRLSEIEAGADSGHGASP